jgi:hypothetical protein
MTRTRRETIDWDGRAYAFDVRTLEGAVVRAALARVKLRGSFRARSRCAP